MEYWAKIGLADSSFLTVNQQRFRQVSFSCTFYLYIFIFDLRYNNAMEYFVADVDRYIDHAKTSPTFLAQVTFLENLIFQGKLDN